MGRAVCFAVLCGLLMPPGPVQADSEVAGRLTLLVRSLTSDYNVKRPGSVKVPLAVFDFACPEALQKQRVGFAVAELLKAKLIQAPEFSLLERADLDKIFAEQSLQQTGAVDANSAVQLGKVVGATLAMSGNVDKLGGSYQVSARLADVATGEVLAVAVQELPARLFEQEAGRYLDLVPEEQAIGLFLGFGFAGAASFTAHRPQVDPAPVYYGISSAEFKPMCIGVGIRYQPVRWGMLEAMVTPMNFMESIKTRLESPSSVVTYPGSGTSSGDLTGWGVDLAGYWVRPVAGTLRVLAGAGVGLIAFDKHLGEDQMGGASFSPDGANYNARRVHLVMLKETPFIRPVLVAGVEWKPQARFGIAVRGALFPLAATAQIGLEHPENSGGTTPIAGSLGELDLPRAAAFTSIAFYF